MKQLRGLFGIAVTPFKENLEVDEDSLRNVIDFLCEGGAQGIVIPVMASEFEYLSETERRRVVELAVEQAKGRRPIIAGVSAPVITIVKDYASYVNTLGVDAVIAMPPYIAKGTPDEILYFYDQLNQVVDVPIFIQNHDTAPLGLDMLIRLIKEFEHIQYIKEETLRANQLMTNTFKKVKEENLPEGSLMGIMGGKASTYLVDEHMRGGCGNMPACEFADVLGKVWDVLDEGKFDDGLAMFNRVLPGINLEKCYGGFAKYVLKKRGIIKEAVMRRPGGGKMDAEAIQFIDRVLEDIKPMYNY